MEGRARRAIRVVIATLAVLTVVAAASVLEGALAGEPGGRWPWFFGANTRSPLAATVTYVQRYSRCGDTTTSAVETTKDELPGVLAGLPAGWMVKESRDTSAIVQRDVDGFCPEHEDYRFIALYRGSPAEKLHVCVFRGRKADPVFMVKECRDLTEDALYPQDRERLKAGVPVFPEAEDPPGVDLDEKAGLYLSGIALDR